jgi:hypothetical protein
MAADGTMRMGEVAQVGEQISHIGKESGIEHLNASTVGG